MPLLSEDTRFLWARSEHTIDMVVTELFKGFAQAGGTHAYNR